MTLRWLGARCAAVRIEDGGLYHTLSRYRLLLNGKPHGGTDRVLTMLHGLFPESEYRLTLLPEHGDAPIAALRFATPGEYVTLNVRAFGARGDGTTEDTAAIQAAILACPPESRVLIPAGNYPVTHLFLGSDIRLEIARGARLLGIPERDRIPILPGMVQSTDEASEYNLGTWEGNPLRMYASLLTGIGVKNVEIYGEGLLDGRASIHNWWHNPKRMDGAFRPRMAFFNRCSGITMAGLTLQNSPAWNIHPYFSKDIRLLGLTVSSPADSPNTDGINPESCTDVSIEGALLSVGDDCIAIKSGKRYMGDAYRTPCRNIHIAHCRMGDGHGAVTLGSEMSGGICGVLVEACAFHDTDRGLRVKTRRGRGSHGVIDGVTFRNIRMERVKTPLTVNCFYSCDPDGNAPDVQDRLSRPVDAGTPQVRRLRFEGIRATGCEVAAGYFLGLPERPIEAISLRDIEISFADAEAAGMPVMTAGMQPVAKAGLHAVHVDSLEAKDVSLHGVSGARLVLEGVKSIDIAGGNLE